MLPPDVLLHPDYVFLFEQVNPQGWGSLTCVGEGIWSLDEAGRLRLMPTEGARTELVRLVQQYDTVVMLEAREFAAKIKGQQTALTAHASRN